MSIYESITLLGIMGTLAAIPSASVALVVARSATLGIANGLAVVGGIVLGDLVFIAFALLGLSVIAEAMGSLFMIVKVIGGIYLIWLGCSLFSKSGETEIKVNKTNNNWSLAASFVAGFVLALGDIKAIIFYASLLPVFVDLSAIQSSDILTLIFITIFSVGGVKAIYAIFSDKVAAYAQKTNMESTARKTVGGLMVGAGGYLIVKA
ncbi:MAG TPA: LysE family translocator [Gammaproteobacteria bacterium]|nr:LysE family translocator [Gammaproteobacteria bacterium]